MSAKILSPRYEPVPGQNFSGGMGETICCTDLHLDRAVLVKTLKPGTDNKRIRDEVAALAEVRSKHVVQLYDVITDDAGEVVGIVEEYLDGADVAALTIGSFDQLLNIGYPIACGIADIHQHGIVHRDIKPNNMRYDGEGCLKIYDFGLARFDGKNAHTKLIVGTPGFMAPELFVASGAGNVAFDAAVDTYAFGVTLFFMATGAVPASTPSFSALPFSLPAEVTALLDGCFAVSPASRPSMAEIRDCFKLYLTRDQHRALVVTPSRQFILDSVNRQVNVNSTGRGSFTLTYTGLYFEMTNVAGDVYVNNVFVTSSLRLPGSCVIVLGAPSMASARVSISVDISHPEAAV